MITNEAQKELIKSIQRGDQAAENKLIRYYLRVLNRFYPDYPDLVQDVLFYFIRRVRSGEFKIGEHYPWGYVRKALLSKIATYHKRSKKSHVEIDKVGVETTLASSVEAPETPLHKLLRKEHERLTQRVDQELSDAIERLKDPHKQIMRWTLYDGKKPFEIREKLDLPKDEEQTVYELKRRALNLLEDDVVLQRLYSEITKHEIDLNELIHES